MVIIDKVNKYLIFMPDRQTEDQAIPELLIAGYVADMGKRLEIEFPLITSDNLAGFADGSVSLGSFDIRGSDGKGILAAMFDRAANPQDQSILSSHALRHNEVFAAMGALAERVRDGGINIKKYKFIQKGTKQQGCRYEFTGLETFEMEWPEALVEAGRLTDRNESEQVTELRKIATECGYDIAMLAAAYLDLDDKLVFEGVFDKRFLRTLDDGGFTIPARRRIRNNLQNTMRDEIIYSRLRSIINKENNLHLQRPNTYPLAYEEALKILMVWGCNPNNLMVYKAKLQGTAVAIVPSLMARAYQVANSDFREPKLTEAAQRYEEQVQTNVVTGYVRWNFQTMEVVRKARSKDRNPEIEVIVPLGNMEVEE